jgi:hypothetical protein
VLLERVNEAQRLATRELRESQSELNDKKKGKKRTEIDEDTKDHENTNKKNKSR